ncbi:glycosyl transferase group 1 [Thiorhodococcus drewsii AZ1]|uniref:Glycosyl transferase group 1 n=1 Tax=Thiorhodococcus drewsii AZ1 TaxID=765913 RepID=G2E7R2_9GAMM|nr:glycosyltransferase [Thiorhodococcus drewsii]EGV27860.1 glycosyl transferase group 1 [Thiorhodococcus drewsii AZ1]
MRILVDLQACQSSSRLGGIGRYSLHLLEAMARHAGQHELRVLLNDLMADSIPGLYEHLGRMLPREQIQVFQVPGPVAEHDPANQARARAAELIREGFIQQFAPDIVHVASLVEGLGDDVVSSVGELFPGDSTAVTFYDLIPLVDKERYLTAPVITEHYYRKIAGFKRAGGLLAISEFSRQQGIDELGLDPDRIVNIAAGVDERFRPLSIPPDQAAAVRQRYGIRGGFLLFTSSFDQRKNHGHLIQAFARLPRELRRRWQLVIIGNGWDAIYAHFRKLGADSGLSDDELVFTGHVGDDDLLALYNLCDLFVFPSLSEGYGLPVLEAMACGIPTIASNTTSIPEVVGRADALFDPHDIDSIAAKMREALSDDGFRCQLAEHGLSFSRRFTWDASAKRALEALEAQYERTRRQPKPAPDRVRLETIAALRRLADKTPRSSPDAVRIAAALSANGRCLRDLRPRPSRIGWITTWNTRCGIATYSRHLAGAHLSDYWFFAPYELGLECPDEPNVIRCWHPGQDDLRLLAEQIDAYQIDTLVIQFNYGFFDFESFRRFLQEMIGTGRRLYVELHSTTDTPEKHLAEFAVPLALCNGIFIHSQNDAEVLARLGLTDNVEIFPHGVPDLTPAQVALEIPRERFVVASYGFFLPHKGLFELIDACRILIAEQGIDLHLLMINAEYPVAISAELIAEARERIRAYGLEDRVTLVADFLDHAQSLAYLRQADLILYPYQETGESVSGAVRMGLAAQRPVAVTPLAIFDDVAEAVWRLPGTDPMALAQGILDLRRRLLDADPDLQQIQAQAVAWLDTHSYARLSEVLWERLTA